MDEFAGLFSLLFASINSFILINILIFARSNKKAKYIQLLAASLLLAQLSEFFICFVGVSYPWLNLMYLAGVWVFPVFTIILIAVITGFPKRLIAIYYLLCAVAIIMLITNYYDVIGSCSLLVMYITYPSQWLFPYFSFGGLIVAGLKLNSSIKNISDELEIKKRKVLLYCILTTLIITLVTLLAVSDITLLESIIGKTGVVLNLGVAFYVIRDRYQTDGK